MPELVFFRRGEEVLRVGLERQRLVLGRGEDCDVVVPQALAVAAELVLLRVVLPLSAVRSCTP
jgi:two-component system response regulator HydG